MDCRVTSQTGGPLPPCKQALRKVHINANNEALLNFSLTFILADCKLSFIHLVTESYVPVREKWVDRWNIGSARIRHPPLSRIFVIKLDLPHNRDIEPVAHHDNW